MSPFKKILIIDDNISDRIILSKWTQETFPEAVIITEKEVVPGYQDVDLIVVDVNLSKTTGSDTLELVHKNYPNTQIFAVSGTSECPPSGEVIEKDRFSYEKGLKTFAQTKELDRIASSFEKMLDTLKSTLEKQSQDVEALNNKTILLEDNVKDLIKSVRNIDNSLRGNGQTGIVTKVEVLSDKVSKLEEFKSFSSSKKEKYAIWTAVGSGIIAGVYSIIKDLLF